MHEKLLQQDENQNLALRDNEKLPLKQTLISDLPTEVLQQIFSFLRPRVLAKAWSVICK